MAPSLDCAASSLLCAEDNSVIFYDDDDDGVVDNVAVVGFDYGWHHGNHRRDDNRNQNFYGEEALIELSVQSEECLAEMLHRECEHLPVSDYLERLKNGELDLVARQEVVDWIIKVRPFLRQKKRKKKKFSDVHLIKSCKPIYIYTYISIDPPLILCHY